MRLLFAALLAVTVGSACGPSAASPADASIAMPADAVPVPDAIVIDGRSDAPPIVADACPLMCNGVCCADQQTCQYQTCVPSATCNSDDDCENDSYCDDSTLLCIPYGVGPRGNTDPTCQRVAVIGVFAPAVACDWTAKPTDDFPDYKNVYATPMVADFDFDDNKALVHPSIVFTSSNTHGGGADECTGDDTHFGVIRVIDGQSCQLQYSISDPHVVAAAPVALADLDGDGRPEIIAQRVGGGIVAFTFDPVARQWVMMWQYANDHYNNCMWSGPSVHDLDDDGKPEVLIGATVLNGQTGALIDSSLGLAYYAQGQIPVVADLDGDGKPELLIGDGIYTWTASAPGVGTWVAKSSTLGARGFVAVADFGTYGSNPQFDNRAILDGIPEVVVVSNGLVRIQTPAGRLIMPPTSLPVFTPSGCPASSPPGPGQGGPPTIADFDGDGRVEVGVAAQGSFTVFDLDCAGTPTAATCATLQTNYILWKDKSQDCSSSSTGSAVFDFEADGKAEVVYADECFTRVYNGGTGEVEFSQSRNSCTWYENPVVADVGGNLKSRIVVPSNDNCNITCPALDDQFAGLRCLEADECPNNLACVKESAGDPFGFCRCQLDTDCGGTGYVCVDPATGPSGAGKVCRASHTATPFQGVRVIRDALDRWVDSRPIWNQEAYTVTNVNDDGTIPRTSLWTQNWLTPKLNNYRQNINRTLDTTLSVDVTAHGSFECNNGIPTLLGSVCNRGAADLGQGVPLTFYEGDPAQKQVICTVRTTATITPGTCMDVQCTWTTAPVEPADVTGVADDDGTGNGENHECHEGNNALSIPAVYCHNIGRPVH